MTWEILRKRELIINLTKLKIKYGKIEKFLSFLLTRVRFGFAHVLQRQKLAAQDFPWDFQRRKQKIHIRFCKNSKV